MGWGRGLTGAAVRVAEAGGDFWRHFSDAFGHRGRGGAIFRGALGAQSVTGRGLTPGPGFAAIRWHHEIRSVDGRAIRACLAPRRRGSPGPTPTRLWSRAVLTPPVHGRGSVSRAKVSSSGICSARTHAPPGAGRAGGLPQPRLPRHPHRAVEPPLLRGAAGRGDQPRRPRLPGAGSRCWCSTSTTSSGSTTTRGTPPGTWSSSGRGASSRHACASTTSAAASVATSSPSSCASWGAVETAQLVARLRNELRAFNGRRPSQLSLAIGGASYPEDGSQRRELSARADSRMYEDKRRRRATAPVIPIPTAIERITRLAASRDGAARPGGGRTVLVHRSRNIVKAAPTILRPRFVAPPRNMPDIRRRRASRGRRLVGGSLTLFRERCTSPTTVRQVRCYMTRAPVELSSDSGSRHDSA